MSPNLIRANVVDARHARTHALDNSGYTVEQLREQAKRGSFESTRARRAWVIVSGIDQAVTPRD